MSVARHVAVRALDALEEGDLGFAAELLRNGLEDEDASSSVPPACPTCGARAWPGQTERHVFSAHRDVEEVRRAA